MRRIRTAFTAPAIIASLLLAGCGLGGKTDTQEDSLKRDEYKFGSLLGGDGGNSLYGGNKKKSDQGDPTGLGVNSFQWRASLDTLAFLPIVSADPFGGVILTDWYTPPETPNERFKVNLYILDRQLRADGIRVSVFKQKMDKSGWHDVKIPDDMATSIENTILTRAREMRVAQLAPKKG